MNSLNIQNLCIKTDIEIWKHVGRFYESKDFWVLQCPENPLFYAANSIIAKKAPKRGDLKYWLAFYDKQFPYYEKINHYFLSWDEDSEGDISELTEYGFEKDYAEVLTCVDPVQPKNFNSNIKVQKLERDRDWDRVYETHLQESGKAESQDHQEFLRLRNKHYRYNLSELGQFLGAFIDGELCGSLGIYRCGDLVRYQNVVVAKEHRRKGVAASLVY